MYVNVDTQCSSLDEDVAEFRFELGVERGAVKTKHVVVCLRKLNS